MPSDAVLDAQLARSLDPAGAYRGRRGRTTVAGMVEGLALVVISVLFAAAANAATALLAHALFVTMSVRLGAVLGEDRLGEAERHGDNENPHISGRFVANFPYRRSANGYPPLSTSA